MKVSYCLICSRRLSLLARAFTCPVHPYDTRVSMASWIANETLAPADLRRLLHEVSHGY